MKFRDLYHKYQDIILYGFFGVCTTAVNVISYWIMAHAFKLGTMPSTLIAWILAVLFAYVTNRKWVFRSEANNKKDIIKELISFFSCRIATGFVDWGCMFIFVDILKLNDLIIKVIANIIVIVLNYIASKLIIFKKKNNKKKKSNKKNSKKNIQKDVLLKMNKKQKTITIILALLIIGVTGFSVYNNQNRLTYIEYKSVTEKDQEYISIINSNDTLSQEFVTPYNILHGVKVKIGTHKKDNNSRWKLLIEDKDTKEIIYSMDFNASLLKDKEYNYFEFDKNIPVKKNKVYILKIVGEKVSDDTKLSFFKSIGKETDDKTLSFNGEKILGKLCVQIHGGTKDLWWAAFSILIGVYFFLLLVRGSYVVKRGKSILEDKLFLSMLVGGIVFYLLKYFSIDSVFIDEYDNIRGGMIISKGGVLYKDYVTQHTPFVYYLCSVFSLFRAVSLEQFRLFYYVLLGLVWGFLYYRHSSYFGKNKMFILPIIMTIVIVSIMHPRGHQILSDGVQGICTVALLLEFLRYYQDKEIGLGRSIIISICMWCSFGSAFISAYSLVWIVLAVFVLEVIYWIKRGFSFKGFITRYYKLIICMLIPLIVSILYFYFNDALKDAFEQFYLFNREVYPNYTGLGDNLFQPFIDAIRHYFTLLSDKVTLILHAKCGVVDLLQLSLITLSSILIVRLIYKKRYIEALTMFFVLCCSATRGYNFHSLPAWYVAVMICVLFFTEIKDYIPKKIMPFIIIFALTLSSTYVIKLSQNILYEAEPITAVENFVIKNTKENDKVFVDFYSCDSLYIIYKNRKPVNRVPYMLPWYMDWYEEKTIDELVTEKPNIVIYNDKKKTWGYSNYSNAYLKRLKKDYRRLSNDTDSWKYIVWEKRSNI